MAISGFVLITISVANVLASQARHCNCDYLNAQNALHHQPQLYYYPIVPVYGNNHVSHQLYQQQHVGHVPVGNAAQLVHTAFEQSGYANIGQHEVVEQGASASLIHQPLQVGQVVQATGTSLDHQHVQQQDLHSNGAQVYLDTSHLQTAGHLQQSQISAVSTHDNTHYVNIEQHISPHSDHLEDANDHHHHGKNDNYKFEYAVNDPKTNDIKQHKEEKNGDVVTGEYSLVEEDGNVRTVKYYADWQSGFHAQVYNSKTTPLG